MTFGQIRMPKQRFRIIGLTSALCTLGLFRKLHRLRM